MTERQRNWYEDKLNAFTEGRGLRYELVSGMTYAAAACGLTADDVIYDCRNRMSDFTGKHADDIRRGVSSAYAKMQTLPTNTSVRDPHPTASVGKVRELIRAGGMSAKMDDLQNIRGGTATSGLSEAGQTRLFLSHLYGPREMIHVENSQRHETALLGIHLRTRNEWLSELSENPLYGDILGRNPYSGTPGTTGDGKTSLTASSCVSSFKYALVEFDLLPIAEQCAFWIGFLRQMPRLTPFLVSLVYSGGKSIHGLLRVNADSRNAKQTSQGLKSLFCTDGDKTYRADPMGFGLRGGTRLAGARRKDNDNIQQLLFIK